MGPSTHKPSPFPLFSPIFHLVFPGSEATSWDDEAPVAPTVQWNSPPLALPQEELPSSALRQRVPSSLAPPPLWTPHRQPSLPGFLVHFLPPTCAGSPAGRGAGLVSQPPEPTGKVSEVVLQHCSLLSAQSCGVSFVPGTWAPGRSVSFLLVSPLCVFGKPSPSVPQLSSCLAASLK